jgi:hypothetical protein
MRERDCFANFQSRLCDESWTTSSKETVESFAGIADMTTANKSTRYVWPTHRAAAGFLHHRRKVDIDSQTPQTLDDVLCALLARVSKINQLLLELLRFRNVQSEKMYLTRPIVRAQLNAAYDTNAEWSCGELGLLQSGKRVVIGERDGREARGSCCIDNGRRRKRAVGCGRVHVQIDLTGLPLGLPRAHHFL